MLGCFAGAPPPEVCPKFAFPSCEFSHATVAPAPAPAPRAQLATPPQHRKRNENERRKGDPPPSKKQNKKKPVGKIKRCSDLGDPAEAAVARRYTSDFRHSETSSGPQTPPGKETGISHVGPDTERDGVSGRGAHQLLCAPRNRRHIHKGGADGGTATDSGKTELRGFLQRCHSLNY
jgi:hypothetical protein